MSNLNIRPLDPPLQKVAIEELNEVPERVPEDIEALRTWINQQPHLKARTDDQFLVGFLRGCKWSMEKAKSKIDKFYTMRTKYPHLFNCTDLDGTRFRKFLRTGTMLHLPTPFNGNAQRILMFRPGCYDPNEFTMEECAGYMNVLHEITIREDDHSMVNGFVAIMDLGNATGAHFINMTPSLMKKMSVFTEQALPMRQKAGYFINAPTIFDKIFNTLRPMMSKKQQGRISVHSSNLERFYEIMPKKYLPKEYGGENGTVEEIIAYTLEKVEEYAEYLKDNANYGTDESLRVGQPIDFESLFGLEGSFRKLDVD